MRLRRACKRRVSLSYAKGKEITIGDIGETQIIHAGTVRRDGKLLTSGGRVLGVVAKGKSVDARAKKRTRQSKISSSKTNITAPT